MMSNLDTLLVSHIPNSFSDEDCNSFFKHFGASKITYYGIKGRMKNKAHIFYRNFEEAKLAMMRLHQLEVLTSRLIVQYASSKSIKSFTDSSKSNSFEVLNGNEPNSNLKNDEDSDIRKKIARGINSLSHYYNFEYPINQNLKYSYPAPTVSILTNIANALASVPKLYVQVLHLMNKMNLPAPFGNYNLPETAPIDEYDSYKNSNDIESEIESETEQLNDNIKKRRIKYSKLAKVPKLSLSHFYNIHLPSSQTTVLNPKEVFEEISAVAPKKIDIKVVNEEERSFKNSNELLISEPSDSGFGKIYPNVKDSTNLENLDKELEWDKIDFISDDKLKNNRISADEIKTLSIFKNYSPGDSTIRLYIKNLSKKVTENDLHFIYGRYVDWDLNDERIMYDIRLMKEGKMKGQAFITLPNVASASLALKETNGFMLLDKPMVVCFARSAKAKIS